MGRRISKSPLRRRAISNTSPRQIISEFVSIASGHATTSYVSSVGSLGAPFDATTSVSIAVVVNRGGAWALNNAEICGIV